MVKRIIIKFLPSIVKDLIFSLRLKWIKANHKREIARISKKGKVTVVFFVIFESVWKYEGIYKLMEKDSRFNPLVIVCPYLNLDEEKMMRQMETIFQSFKQKGYNILYSFEEQSGNWIDVKKEIQPDLVFFSVPYNYTKPEYCINNFLDTLTCYVPYFFVVNDKDSANFDQFLHNVLWKAFYESSIHKKLAQKHARNKGENVVVSGYPGLDAFFDETYKPADPWKIKDPSFKRIIWAPHHTIEGQGSKLDYSNFKEYSHDMFAIAEQYNKKIQIAFKPHPFLKQKLYNDSDWGKYKTDEYYEKWSNLANGQLVEGQYTDLFLTSDALIHDCSSFMVEYLCTGKPYLYMVKDGKVSERMNEFGQYVYSKHYHSYNKNDVLSFIDDVVFGKIDPKKEQRQKFVKKYIKEKNNNSSSEVIFNYIKNSF